MTLAELAQYTVRLIEILNIDDVDVRDKRIANLMSDLEHAYNIPVINNDEFNQENELLIGFYRIVSDLRSF